MVFEDFILSVDPQYQEFTKSIHDYMVKNECTLKMTDAKNGYVVSYQQGKKKRVILNFVFRKNGLHARIYADHVAQYLDLLESLPESMKKAVVKAPSCKRFDDPPKCNSKCIGYIFTIADTQHQKCRYNCFLFLVTNESIPHIWTLVEKELSLRTG